MATAATAHSLGLIAPCYVVIVRKGEGVGDTALLHTQVEGCCSFPLSFCPALLAEGVRARVHSQYYTAQISTAACPFLPLPYCHRPEAGLLEFYIEFLFLYLSTYMNA